MKENNVKNNLPVKQVSSAIQKTIIFEPNGNLQLKHSFTFGRQSWGVRSVNFSNNRLIITNAQNSELKILDLQKLEALPFSFRGHSDSVRLTSISNVSNNSKSFVTASWDGSYKIFDFETGLCIKTLRGHSRSPSCFLDPENNYLFTASYDSDINPEYKNAGKCWDLLTEKVIHTYRHTFDRISQECCDIAYDPKHKLVITCSDDGVGQCWLLTSDKPKFQYFHNDKAVRKLAISEKYAGFACSDGYVRIHHKLSGEKYRYFIHNDRAEVLDIKFSNDQSRVYSASSDGSVKCYNLQSGKLIFQNKIHSSWIWSICLTDDNEMLISGSLDGSVVFTDGLTGEIIVRLLNAPWQKEFIFISGPDEIYKNGFFYSTNKNFIEVISIDKDKNTYKALDKNDPKRISYIDKLNLKNLIKSKLKKNGLKSLYDNLSEKHIKNQKKLTDLDRFNVPKVLNIGF